VSHEPLRVAVVEGEMYSPLYERLSAFTTGTGRPVEVAARLPLPELIAHLREALPRRAEYDLVSAHSQYTAGLAPFLEPLDGLLSPGELREFSSVSLDLCSWDGAVYQLPRSLETRLLYYRSDIFEDRREQQWFAEASGGNELRVPPTWEELAAVAQYFTREGKLYGYAFPGRGSGLVSHFAEILTTAGGTFFDHEGRPRFFSRAGEWALTLLQDLYRRWEAVPPETPDCSFDEVSGAFRMGRCAMACDFTGTARLLRDPTFSAVAGWHSVALFPAGPGGRRAVWAGCPTFAVPAACADREAAADLLRFLTGHESQLLEAKHGAFPSRTAACEETRENLRAGTIGHLRFTLAEQTLRLASLTAPKLPQYAEIEERLWPLLQQAVLGHQPPAEALEQGSRAVDEALRDGGAAP
jgi:multiple sugar transport system substrate-binding protein